MKTINRLLILLTFLPLIIFLASCSETAENEHLPEYCQTYSGFMSTASKDLYELVDGINRDEYLTSISVIELEFDSAGFDHEIDLSGIQCFQNLTSLTLTGPGFKDISPISALKNIQEISLIDTSIVSIDSFKNLSKIKELNITGTKTLQSVDGVEEMIKLTNLVLTDNGIVNIDGLNNLVNLRELNLSYNEISFFPNINQLNNLTDLNVSFNNISRLGDDLSGLSSLKTLNMSYNEICDLETLDDLISLTELDLSYNDLGCNGSGESPDFTSLENSVMLESIKLNDNNLDSIEGLRGLDMPLTTLELQNNNLVDITPISDYTGITNLILYGNNIENISDLSGMTGLTGIDLSKNSIIDFSDLLSIPNLETIDLSENNIVSIPDLVTDDEEFWSRLITLDLSTNNLTDISGVEGHSNLQELLIADNGLTTLSGLSDLPMLSYLEMTWEDPDPALYPTEDDWPEDFYSVSNHNIINRIDNSFNNLPNLPLFVIENEGFSNENITTIFDFGFDLGPGLEIYGSISELYDVAVIDFSGYDIDIIDEFSINLVNLEVLDVSDTNIEDIGFILGNPSLISLVISDTAVSNLSVISGLNTSDLDNLDQVVASNISGDNYLVDSFIELPQLSIIILTGTNIISIDNSFNSISELTSLRIDSTELISIIDSFNNIYDFYTDDNVIRFNSSKIGVIEGSFNAGNYYFIEIKDNNSTGITYITDSFNDLTTPNNGYIDILRNDFATIEGSFNNLDINTLAFNDNASIGTTYITDSFNDITTALGGAVGIFGNAFATIDRSFNTLDLDSFAFYDNAGTGTTYISESFNDLTATENGSIYVGGNDFATVDLSFNNLDLNTLIYSDNAGIGETSITASFNNITTFASDSVEVILNDFRIITDSFNNVTTDRFLLNDNFIESITTSFVELDVSSYFYIRDNRLSTLVGLDQVTNVPIFDISNNMLTTVSFIDGIAGLNHLNISNQYNNEHSNNTLDGIDGINNMPGLIGISMFMNQIYDIDGFKNIGITELVYSKSDNVGLAITSITSDSFSNTGITVLDFEGHNFDDIAFLDNFTDLINLNISIDLVDLSYFETAIFEDTLQILTLENIQETADFSSLVEYDNLEFLVFSSDNTLTINNFDGLDSLELVQFVNKDNLIEFNNSFNSMPSLNADPAYLLLYLSLTTIDSSFDMYTSEDSILIDGSLSLVDSFNNVGVVNLASDIETLFYIDPLSFDNMDTLIIETSNHDSFAVLNNYSNLNSLIIEDLNKNITDLSNSNITVLSILNADFLVDTFTLDISPIGDLEVYSGTGGTIDFNTVNDSYNIALPVGNAILNIDNLNANISGNYTDLTMNSDNVVAVELSNFTAETSTFNSNVLNSIVDTSQINFGDSMIVNSLETTMNVDVRVSSLYINDINANDYTIDTNSGNAYLNTNQPDLIVEYVGTNLYAEYNLLETIDLTGSLDEVILTSTSLDTATLNNSTINTATITSDQVILDVTGTNINNLYIENNSINNLSADTIGATVVLTTSSIEILNLSMNASELELIGPNIPEVITDNTSIIDNINISDGTLVNTVTLNEAVIGNFHLLSNETTLDITGNNASNILLDMDNLNLITANIPNSTFDINSNVVAFDLDIIAETVAVDSNNMTDLNIQSSSSMNSLAVLNSPLIDNLTADTAGINTLIIFSDAASMSISGSNVLSSLVVNNLAVGFTADLGSNNLSFSSTKIGSASFNIVGNEVELTTSLSTMSIDNTSTIASLNIFSSNLSNLLAGSSNITSVNINDHSLNLDVTGTNISRLFIGGTSSILNINADLATISSVSNDNSSLLTITTNTGDITISSLGFVDLTSSTLTASTIDIGTNDATVNLTTPAVDYTINGVMGNISIDSSTLNNLIIAAGLVITVELELLNSNVTALDLSNSIVRGFAISGNTTTLDLTGNDLATTNLDLPNLNSLTINSTLPGSTVNILSSDTVIDLNGNIEDMYITENTLTSVDLADITLDTLNITSDALLSLDSLSSVVNGLVIITSTDNFNLTTDVPSVLFNSEITHNLNLTTTSVIEMNFNTNVNTIDFTAPTTQATVFGNNLSSIEGSIDGIILRSNATGTLTVDMDASYITVSDNVFSQIDFIGARTITSTTIFGYELIDLNTNSVSMDSLVLQSIPSVINIDTEVDDISIGAAFEVDTINAVVNYNGVSLLEFVSNVSLNIAFTGVSDMNVSVGTGSNVTLNGDLVNLTVLGNSIDTVDTTSLTVSNKYTMNDTLIDDLLFVSLGLSSLLTELEVNTLDSVNISSIVSTLRDTGISLISPITETNIYDDFYNTEYIDLTAQEALDSIRYDGLKDPLILTALNKIRENTYFDHVLDIDLNTAIDGQSYGDMQSYLDSYVISILTTEQQLIDDNDEAFVQAIREAIQATLDETVLVIVELDLTNSVDQSIIDDSTTYATTESGLVGFTIG